MTTAPTRTAPTDTTPPARQHRSRRVLLTAVALTIAVIVALALWLWLPSSHPSGGTTHSGTTVQQVKAGGYDRCAPRPGTRYC